MTFRLEVIKRTESVLLENMKVHYSQPKGFVGRNICYAVYYDGIRYGSIVGGSCTMYLSGRNEFFGIDKSGFKGIINNIFFHIEKQNGKYPTRCFAEKCLKEFRFIICDDWRTKYGDIVIGFESLVELPRTGSCYTADGWKLIGQTKGYTCKRTAGKGTDKWSGKRVWDTKNLRPKKVFVRNTI